MALQSAQTELRNTIALPLLCPYSTSTLPLLYLCLNLYLSPLGTLLCSTLLYSTLLFSTLLDSTPLPLPLTLPLLPSPLPYSLLYSSLLYSSLFYSTSTLPLPLLYLYSTLLFSTLVYSILPLLYLCSTSTQVPIGHNDLWASENVTS